MTRKQFDELRLNDPVYDVKGKLTAAYDIDRNKRTVKTSRLGGSYRDYRTVRVPEQKAKH